MSYAGITVLSAASVKVYVLAYPAWDSPLNGEYRPTSRLNLQSEPVISSDTDIAGSIGYVYRDLE
jgi:hypothetical protein